MSDKLLLETGFALLLETGDALLLESSGGGTNYPLAVDATAIGIVFGTVTFSVAALPASAFTLSGPASAVVSVESTNFTVTPTGGVTSGTFTPNAASGCTFNPATLTWTGDAVAKTFTVTKTTVGTVTINGTFSDNLTPPTGVSFSATLAPATAFTLTGPTAGFSGSLSSNFTVTPNGSTSGTFTPNVVNNTTFAPTTLTWTGDNAAQTFRALKTNNGTVAVNGTFSDGLTPPTSISYVTSTAPPSDATIINQNNRVTGLG